MSDTPSEQPKKAFKHSVVKIVVVTTAMLTFISYWRAAAIVAVAAIRFSDRPG